MAGIAHPHVNDTTLACNVIEVDVSKCDKDGLSVSLKAALDRVVAERRTGCPSILLVRGVFAVWNQVTDVPSRKCGNPELRAVAALGQMQVASCCERILSAQGLVGAQLLLSSDTFSSVAGRNGVAYLLSRLLGLGTIPILFKNYITELTGENSDIRFRDQLGELISTQMFCRYQNDHSSNHTSAAD